MQLFVLLMAAAVSSPLEYRGARGCPDAASFARRVGAHGADVQAPPTGAHVVVDLRGTAAGGPGRVWLIEKGVPTQPREIAAGSCEEIADALALVVALGLGPARVGVTRPADAGRPAVWTIGTMLSAVGVVSPTPLAAAALFVERASPAPRAVRLDVRLSLEHARNDVVSDGAARFARTLVGVDVCPLGTDAGRARLSLCGRAAAGLVAGTGVDVAHPERRTSWWFDAGPRGRAGVALGPAVVALEGGVAFPWRRTEYRFDAPRVVVGRVPAAVWQAGASVALRFP